MLVLVGTVRASGDTICYEPDKGAVYKEGVDAMYNYLNKLADKEGLFKLDFETQHVKIYLIVNDKGKVIQVINAGCVLDPRIEKIVWKMFMSLNEFHPAEKNGGAVTSARLFDFTLYPYHGTEFTVRVKLEEVGVNPYKDFSRFMNMYVKQIKTGAAYPAKYKHDKLDGLVKVEFAFNAKGKPTAFTITKSDGEEFVANSLISLFTVKPISNDYQQMIGKQKRFTVTYDFVAFDEGEFIPKNH